MALPDYFLAPLGLAALASVVPLLLLYLLRPEPDRIALPTFRFLDDDEGGEERYVALDRLRRNLLLLVQLLALLIVSTALASPYVPIAEERTIDETVVVADASASMATRADGTTRFDRAMAAARDAVTGTTSVVVSGGGTRVALQRGSRAEADRTLDGLSVTDAPGDLAVAIDQASQVAGEGARIVVVSDFAGESDWRGAVDAVRARGHRVEFRQFRAGGADNVGIVDYRFDGRSVTATVRNYGGSTARRSVRLGGATETLAIDPGSAAAVTFDVPEDGGELRLSPGDSFPTDDVLPIAVPRDPTIEVLLLSNDPSRFLVTALSLVDPVELTVRAPPTTVTERYDVVVFGDVVPDRVLPGNIETARATLGRGGGVAIAAQPDVGRVGYRDLLLVDPAGVKRGSSVRSVDEGVVRGIAFTPPERYVSGTLRDGRALLTADDGSPLIATASRGGGRLLYYGLIENASSFKYNYMYPVFWKQAVFDLTGRPTIAELNRHTGSQLQLAPGQTVEGPTGREAGPTVALDAVGIYAVGDRQYAAALANPEESNVTAPAVAPSGGGAPGSATTEERQVPFELSPHVAGVAVGVVLLELLVLRRRGDL